jgi:hypothetical protein
MPCEPTVAEALSGHDGGSLKLHKRAGMGTATPGKNKIKKILTKGPFEISLPNLHLGAPRRIWAGRPRCGSFLF